MPFYGQFRFHSPDLGLKEQSLVGFHTQRWFGTPRKGISVLFRHFMQLPLAWTTCRTQSNRQSDFVAHWLATTKLKLVSFFGVSKSIQLFEWGRDSLRLHFIRQVHLITTGSATFLIMVHFLRHWIETGTETSKFECRLSLKLAKNPFLIRSLLVSQKGMCLIQC